MLAACLVALWHPPTFTWFSGPLIPWGLGMIMVGMGMHLSWEDFTKLRNSSVSVLIGVGLQFSVMPILGWSLAETLELPMEYYAGLVLVSVCPGGTASNVIAFLARANLALSVVLTSVSTFLAVAFTPILATWILGSKVAVDTGGLFLSTVQVILVPVVLGLGLNRFFPQWAEKGRRVSGFVSVLFITLIVASIIGSGRGILLGGDPKLFAGCLGLHFGGFFFGYGIVRWILRRDVIDARTISIEVGMQNSGLGVVLARENFLQPETAIPSALSSLIHSLLGSILAAFWRISIEKSVDKNPP